MTSVLGHEPPVFQHFVEDFSRFQATSELKGNRFSNQLETVTDPTVGSHFFVFSAVTKFDSIGVKIVEQSAGLIFSDIKSGEPNQPTRVVACVNHFG